MEMLHRSSDLYLDPALEEFQSTFFVALEHSTGQKATHKFDEFIPCKQLEV